MSDARSSSRSGRRGSVRLVLAACLSVGAIAVMLTLAVQFLRRGDDAPPRAVIVDQLSATDPGPAFADEATSMLKSAGYRVDYVPPEQVTVDFYRELPRKGYDLIIVRSHSSQERTHYLHEAPSTSQPNGRDYSVQEKVVGLFTNEAYSGKTHVAEQRTGQLSGASYPAYPERGSVFGVNPEFVSGSMRGSFGGARIILMGCGGLNSTGMAQALVARGASEIISWQDLVTAVHTDKASLRLLAHLIEGDTAADAAGKTMDEVGADPEYGSRLLAYP